MQDNDLYLQHYGVMGMKWGVTRADGSYKNLPKAQKKYDKALKKNWIDIFNATASAFNNGISEKLNTKYSDVNLDTNPDTARAKKYVEEMNSTWEKTYASEAEKIFGKRPINS